MTGASRGNRKRLEAHALALAIAMLCILSSSPHRTLRGAHSMCEEFYKQPPSFRHGSMCRPSRLTRPVSKGLGCDRKVPQSRDGKREAALIERGKGLHHCSAARHA